MKKILTLLTAIIICSCSTEEGEIKKSVLVLGNSIVNHKPEKSIEWYGNWGMAATTRENDFAHILKSNIPNYRFDIKNTFGWETDFGNESYGGTVHYDYIFVKVSENVQDLEMYEQELPKLLNSYKDSNTKVILMSSIWFWDIEKNKVNKRIADNNGYLYVDLGEDVAFALNEYENEQLAYHPNDEGMRTIANKCLEKID